MWAEVEETFVREYDGTAVTLTVGGEEIAATDEHPFWVVEGEGLESRPYPAQLRNEPRPTVSRGKWVEADDLRPGDVLLNSCGGEVTVTATHHRRDRLAVYNFRVADVHTYTVGSSRVLVHNNNDCAQKQPPNGEKKPVVPHKKGYGGVSRDGTGKVHGDGQGDPTGRLPSEVPESWTRGEIEDSISELKDSIAKRKEVTKAKGDTPGHQRRITEESELLRKLEKRLESMPPSLK